MILVPTLQKMVDDIVAQDFWVNHRKNREDLDRQNEGELSYDDYVINQMTARMLGRAPILRVSRIDLAKMYPKAVQ